MRSPDSAFHARSTVLGSSLSPTPSVPASSSELHLCSPQSSDLGQDLHSVCQPRPDYDHLNFISPTLNRISRLCLVPYILCWHPSLVTLPDFTLHAPYPRFRCSPHATSSAQVYPGESCSHLQDPGLGQDTNPECQPNPVFIWLHATHTIPNIQANLVCIFFVQTCHVHTKYRTKTEVCISMPHCKDTSTMKDLDCMCPQTHKSYRGALSLELPRWSLTYKILKNHKLHHLIQGV